MNVIGLSPTNYGEELYKQARIYPIALRDGSEPGLRRSFSDFGLLLNRCVIRPSGQSWTNGTLEVISFKFSLSCSTVASFQKLLDIAV